MTGVLCVGVPRSGTTWVARVLAHASGAEYVEEPDNHFRFAWAYRAKSRFGTGQYPSLSPARDDPATADFQLLWERAFAGPRVSRPRAARQRAANRLVERAGVPRVVEGLQGARPRLLRLASALAVPEASRDSAPVVAKSVYAPLAVEWIAARVPVPVVVVLRHPLNVISSWIALGWTDFDSVAEAFTPEAAHALAERFGANVPASSNVARATWLVGVLTCELEAACRRNPRWTRVLHEDLCAKPSGRFASLARASGLGWSPAGDALLAETDRPGARYDMSRLTAELPDAWKRRLAPDVVAEARQVLERLPLESV